MNIRLNDSYLSGFVSRDSLDAIRPELDAALSEVKNGTGRGNDFLGWRDLPVDYDREEFARIKAAAERIRQNSEILVVVGIGGSYLGARAAIEYVNGDMYNTVGRNGPEIYFTGNSISAPALFRPVHSGFRQSSMTF